MIAALGVTALTAVITAVICGWTHLPTTRLQPRPPPPSERPVPSWARR